MHGNPKRPLKERVVEAAERRLKADKSVGVLDVFMEVGFLHPTHFEAWKKGLEYIPVLEESIHCGEKKWQQTVKHFLDWAHTNKLEEFGVTYEKTQRHGSSPLQLTTNRDESREDLYKTKFRPMGLTDAQKNRVEKKANKTPDLLVYVHTGKESECSECKTPFDGGLLFLENGNALCLECADMDHLTFLPSGDATLTRRAKKASPLSAVVVKFNRRRRRYERQGLLVAHKAIEEAEASCEADATKRATQRKKAAVRRVELDAKLVKEMTELILEEYPSCPAEEAHEIAAHTAQRGSGRVGRSAAGRALAPDAIHLAVRAWIRHQHTNYDDLLMRGVERQNAREQIAADVAMKASAWQAD